MPEDYKHPHSLKSLSVVPTNDKLDELKRAVEKDRQSGKTFADHNVIDRALDPTKTPQQKALLEKVIDAIRTVFDPEIPVNVYDLGLIYDIAIGSENRVHVKMTLTAPGCPVAGTLPPEVERKIETVPEVTSAKVELVWEPAWTKDRMTEAAMLELGLL